MIDHLALARRRLLSLVEEADAGLREAEDALRSCGEALAVGDRQRLREGLADARRALGERAGRALDRLRRGVGGLRLARARTR